MNSGVPYSPAKPDPFRLSGHTLADKYRCEKVVAEGGFGVVYYATHLTLDVPVAVKVLKVPADISEANRKTLLSSFETEARTVAKIRHPNIVQVMDSGISMMPNGTEVPWMVLEWIDGQTLADLRRYVVKPMTPREAFEIVRPILDVLAVVHHAGIAHRDIKPGNIMLLNTPRGVFPKLLDFGLAKLVQDGERPGSGVTQTLGNFQGFSPEFAAPEQISRARSGPWTDVHAMGLVLIYLLTGKKPYGQQSDVTELMGAALSRTRPSCLSLGVDVGVWESVIAKSVAFRADERYPNAGEFLSALEATLPNATSTSVGSINPYADTGATPVVSTSQPMSQSGRMSSPGHQSRPSLPSTEQPLPSAQGSTSPGFGATTLSGAIATTQNTTDLVKPAPQRTSAIVLGLVGIGLIASVLAVGLSLSRSKQPTPTAQPATTSIAQTTATHAEAAQPVAPAPSAAPTPNTVLIAVDAQTPAQPAVTVQTPQPAAVPSTPTVATTQTIVNDAGVTATEQEPRTDQRTHHRSSTGSRHNQHSNPGGNHGPVVW